MASHWTAAESDLRNGERDLLGTSFRVLPSPLRESERARGGMYIVKSSAGILTRSHLHRPGPLRKAWLFSGKGSLELL